MDLLWIVYGCAGICLDVYGFVVDYLLQVGCYAWIRMDLLSVVNLDLHRFVDVCGFVVDLPASVWIHMDLFWSVYGFAWLCIDS